MDTEATTSLIEQHREEILGICAMHGAGNVQVFGSRARGDHQPESDLDLLVDVVGPTTMWWPGGLIADLEDLLGVRVDVVTRNALSIYMRDGILAEAVKL